MGFLEDLGKLLPATTPAGYQPPDFTSAPQKDAFLDSLPKLTYTPSANPLEGPVSAPNPEYNVADMSHINVGQEALNGLLDNAWNNLKRGIDDIQIATIQGKLNYSPFGDAPYQVVDNYQESVSKLQAQLQSGILDPEDYASSKADLDKSYSAAQMKIAEGERDIASNEREIANEPVSKDYLAMSQAVQSAGDQASLSSRLAYSAPNIIGSSMSLMVPQLAATFGGNLTKALLKSSIAWALGPEIGIPANTIATIGAVGISIAEILYGRSQESFGEVGSTIMDAQRRLKQDYMIANGLRSEAEIPEEIQREIRIQSRRGADMQYKENMFEAASDIAQALLMPLGNFSTNAGSLLRGYKNISSEIQAAKNYNTATRLLAQGASMGLRAEMEKKEEGAQFAYQRRAEDAIFGTHQYINGGFISNVLEDNYDAISSLNLSLIPGIDARGSGRYAQDPEFQFSENSGGMLATLMGGIPTALSVRSDIRAYRAAKRDLQSDGIVNLDGKFSRIDNTILAKYFDRDLRQGGIFGPQGETHHLLEAIRSLSRRSDENGNPLIDPTKASEIISDIQAKQELYESVTDKINRGVSKDKNFFLSRSPEQRNAIQLAKLDAFNFVNDIIDLSKKSDELKAKVETISLNDSKLFKSSTTRNVADLEARLEALTDMREANIIARDGLSAQEAKSETPNISALEHVTRNVESLDRKIAETKSALDEATKALEDEDYMGPSNALIDAHMEDIANDLFLDTARVNYAKVDKIRNRPTLMEYYEKNKHRLSTNVLEEPVEETPEVKEEVAEPISRDEPITKPEPATTVVAPEAVTPEVTTTTEEKKEPTREEIIENMRRDAVKGYLAIVSNSALPIADRLDAFRKYLDFHKLNSDDPDSVSFLQTAHILMREYKQNLAYVKSIINGYQDIAPMINKRVPLFRVVEYINEAGKPAMKLEELASDIPPVQNDESWEGDYNTTLVSSYSTEPGTKLKITSGLSLAGKHVEGNIQEIDGRYHDKYVDNKMQFSENYDQQLANTSTVQVGDTLSVAVEFPDGFNVDDASDYNYDQVKIGLYKEVELGDGTSTSVLINYLHRIDKLEELLSKDVDRNGVPKVNVEAEKSLLRNHRYQIIQAGKDAQFTFEVTKKEFGFINRNAKEASTTVANAIGSDPRPTLSYVDRDGLPNKRGRVVLLSGEKMSSGATIILLPNETGQGTVYIPLYLTKHELSRDPAIMTKVSDSIKSFLAQNEVHTSYLSEAKRYVFILNNPEKLTSLGPHGVYIPHDTTEPTILIRGTEYTKKNMDGIDDAIRSLYFSVSREDIEDPAYQREIMNSPVLSTRITPNKVLLDRSDDKYSFLGPEQKYSYFSQHTVVLGNMTRVDAAPVTPEVTEVSDRETKLNWYTELSKIDPNDNSPENVQRVAELRRTMPSDLAPEEFSILLTRRGDYSDIPQYQALLDTPSSDTHDDTLDLLEGLDLEDPDLQPANPLLVSDEISGTVQEDMIESIAFQLLTNTRDAETSNADKVKSFVMDNLRKFEAAIASPKASEVAKEKGAKVVRNYNLMLAHWDELVKRARKMLLESGEEVNEEDDYYESPDDFEDNDFNNFRDDANRTRNEKELLPVEVKRLLMFIPKVEPTTNKEYAEGPHKGKTYKTVKNQLGMDTFNNFNDSWNKILGVTTGIDKSNTRFFDATRSGFADMINALSKEGNPPVVTIFANILNSAPKKIQNATFRKIRLTYQKNETTLAYYHEKTYNYPDGSKSSTTRAEFRTALSDKKHGIRNVVEELAAEMLRHNAPNTIYVEVFDENTQLKTLKIDTKYVGDLIARIDYILTQDNGFYDSEMIGGEARIFNTLKPDSIDLLYNIIKNEAGFNITKNAFDKLLMYHQRSSNKPNHNAAITTTFRTILKGMATPDADSQYKSIKNAESINVFPNESGAVNVIARYEYQFRPQKGSGAYRQEGKSYYPFIRGNYLSDFWMQFYSKRSGGPGYWIDDKATHDDYARRGRIISTTVSGAYPEFVDSLETSYELGSRNTATNDPSKMLVDMTPREHKLTKLKSFQTRAERSARFYFDTLSDKTTKPKVSYLRLEVSYNTNEGSIDGGTIQLDKGSLEHVYTTYFEGELDRVNNTVRQNGTLAKHRLIKGYHDRGKSIGMGKYFMAFHYLNKAVLDVDNPELSLAMYNDDGSIKPITPKTKELIKNEINKHMNKVFKQVKEDFKDNEMYGVTYTTENGQRVRDVNIMDLVDHRYLTTGITSKGTLPKNAGVMVRLGMMGREESWRKDISNAKYYRLTDQDIDRIADYAVIDYAFNYEMFTMDMWTITGDPAQAGKPVSQGVIDSIKSKYKDNPKLAEKFVLLTHIASSFDNLYKRNASFVASGDNGVWEKEHYNLSIAKDISIDSPELAQYLSLFPDNPDGVTKAYKKGDLTDAQEVTTVEEDLDQQLAYGVIDAVQHRKALYTYDRDAYTLRYGKGEEEIDARTAAELYKLVFQPKKPVQRSYVIDPEMRISKQYYVKTSSFPLIPSMLDGAMLDLLNDMKKNGVQRVAFVSGVKQGVAGEKDLFNEDGSYNNSFFKDNINKLHRNGFRIQLDVPYKEDKSEIREGTQKSKMLFVDLPHDVQMVYNEKSVSVGQLHDEYIDAHREIIDIKTRQLFKELGAVNRNGNVIVTRRFFKNLSEMLVREGEGRGYAMNSLLGLALNDNGEFTIPLTFLPNAAQMEPVITSIVSNRLTRLRIHGKSGVQASEFVLRTGKKGKVVEGSEETLTELKDNRDIVWTKPEYANTEKLRYLRIENAEGELYEGSVDSIPEGYTVKPAQIIMSTHLIDPRYKDKKGHAKKIDIKRYINKDGFLDTSKIDPELLQLNGFRIPFQGHNSAMWFEIIGFLPNVTGDMLVVPGEIAAQMGSDYDVDKLYYYLYNYYLDKDDNIHKLKGTTPIPTEKSEEGMIPHSLEDQAPEDIAVSILQNKMIDIEKSVLMSPYALRAVLEPLSFEDVENTIAEFGADAGSEFLGAASPKYQDDVYFSNVTGKLGVGISANNNTSHALAQQANLFIKGDGVRFRDDNGEMYSDTRDSGTELADPGNSVNNPTSSTYTIVDKEGMTNRVAEADPDTDGAWRLDKIETFPDPVTGKKFRISNLISQILGISVDNAKEQKLGTFGINEHNFNLALTIIRTGFSLNWVYAFINQPILKEYYRAVGGTSDIYDMSDQRFVANRKEQIVKDIFTKYSNMFGVEDPYNKEGFLSTNFNDLKENLGEGVNAKNVRHQFNILKAYMQYKSYADSIQTLSSLINVDTKGAPKDMSTTLQKVNKLQEMTPDDNIGNIDNYLSRTIPGLMVHIPELVKDIFMNRDNPTFAYGSEGYDTARKDIERLTDRVLIKEEQFNSIYGGLKEYIYSGFKFPDEEDNVHDIRSRLTFGETSIQERAAVLQSKIKGNDWLDSIRPVATINADDPKLVSINFSSEDDFIARVSEQWESALYDEKNPELREFAKDLVKYTLYVAPQEFGVSSIIRYVPISYLKTVGFDKYLNSVNKNLDTAELTSRYAEQYVQHNVDFLVVAKPNKQALSSDYKKNGNLNIVLNSFTLPAIRKNNSASKAQGLIRGEGKNMHYPYYLAVFIDEVYGKQVYVRRQNTNSTFTYYRISQLGSNESSEYNMNGDAETMFGPVSTSDVIVPPDLSGLSLVDNTPNNEVESNPRKDLGDNYLNSNNDADDILAGIRETNDNLQNLSPEQARYAKLYQFLAKSMQFKGLDKVTITLDTSTKSAASTSVKSGQITINFNEPTMKKGRTDLGSELEKQRTIIHEFLHALTIQKARESNKDSKEYRDLMNVWMEYRKNVVGTGDKVRGIPSGAIDALLFDILKQTFDDARSSSDIGQSFLTYAQSVISDDAQLDEIMDYIEYELESLMINNDIPQADFKLRSNPQRWADIKNYMRNEFLSNFKTKADKFYAYSNLYEFITEAMTNRNTQKELQSMGSIWPELVSKIKAFIAEILGIESEERTLFDDAVDAVFNFMKLDSSQNESTQPTLFDESYIQSNKSKLGFKRGKC